MKRKSRILKGVAEFLLSTNTVSSSQCLVIKGRKKDLSSDLLFHYNLCVGLDYLVTYGLSMSARTGNEKTVVIYRRKQAQQG